MEEESKRLQEEARIRKEKEDEARYVEGVVRIQNIQVRNLAKTDTVGRSDPFVLFRLGDHQRKTSIAEDTNDYDYVNEIYDLYYDPIRMSRKGKMLIQVWDYDTLGKNDIVGIASVDILPSFQQPMLVELFIQPWKKTHIPDEEMTEEQMHQMLTSQADQKLGKVTFEMEYKPEDQRLKILRTGMLVTLRRKRAQLQSQVGQQKLNNEFVRGIVIVKVLTIRNLPKICVNDAKDIYVQLMLGRNEAKTKIVKSSKLIEVNQDIIIDFDPNKIKE
ncbi:MAG: hypothetical protein EZS28_026690, partial [Streblomastix strix]